jgi:hypothetical protein
MRANTAIEPNTTKTIPRTLNALTVIEKLTVWLVPNKVAVTDKLPTFLTVAEPAA